MEGMNPWTESSALEGEACWIQPKQVSAVIPNDDQVLDDIVLYLSGQKNYANQPLPVIEIPTTAGTGSESTFVAVVTSEKLGLQDRATGSSCLWHRGFRTDKDGSFIYYGNLLEWTRFPTLTSP